MEQFYNAMELISNDVDLIYNFVELIHNIEDVVHDIVDDFYNVVEHFHADGEIVLDIRDFVPDVSTIIVRMSEIDLIATLNDSILVSRYIVRD